VQRWRGRRLLGATQCVVAAVAVAEARAGGGIWIDPARLATLPTSGPAWENLLAAAKQPSGAPNLSDMRDPTNVRVLAKALVYARTGEQRYRSEVQTACRAAIGTEAGGSTLALGRELAAYVLAADLVGGLPGDDESRFRSWLRDVRHRKLRGGTLIETHERRPNNWGTHAGASRAAVAAYLGETEDLARVARIFRGWLGDRSAYAGFRYRALWWQADPEIPVGINPSGSRRAGHSIDGVLPDDQRRSGPFRWPPPHENYVYGALQGALVQAVILDRAGYDVWEWQDRALLRAFRWLYTEAAYPARGDDSWEPHLINFYYPKALLPAPVPTEPGKNAGWTDWTHASANPAPSRAPERPVSELPAPRPPIPFIFEAAARAEPTPP
jgi:alginate lyase